MCQTQISRRLAALFVALMLIIGMVPTPVLAQSPITYLDENGASQTLNESYTPVTSSVTSWSEGWYVVQDDVTLSSRVQVSGNVSLILTDGQTLTCSQGINVPYSSSLTIYAQAEGSGALTAVTSSNAAIGSDDWGTWGDITICGGHITATSEGQAGIGGGYHSDAHGNVSIYGGVIETSGIHGGTPHYGASDMGNILIQGATVTSSRQIGAGLSLSGSTGGISSCGSITIRDSIVQTQSFLGSSSSSWYTGTCEDITVSNSTVLVQGAIGGTDSTLHLNGNTCIVAERSVLTMPESLSGVLVFGTSGTAYSDTQISDIVDLSGISLTVQPGTTLTLPNDAILRSLTVETGAQVQAASDLTVNNATVSGAITVPGTLHNNGTLTVNQDGVISCGSFSNSGTMTTQGQVTARTSFHNAGAVNNSSTGVLHTSGGINDGVMENTGTWVNQGPITGSGVVVSNTEISGAGDQQIAPDAISYLNEDGEVAYIGANDIIYPLTSQVKTWAKFDGATTWYVVTKDTQIDGGVKVTDDVNLLLMDGATLTVNGANYNGGIYVDGGKSLNIYAQSCGNDMGKVVATAGHYNWAPFSGRGCTINIYGGYIDASDRSGQSGFNPAMDNTTGVLNIASGIVDVMTLGWGDTVTMDVVTLKSEEAGNAVIYTDQTSITQATRDRFNGIIFLQKKDGQVLGTTSIPMDLTLTSEQTLTVPQGTILTIPQGTTLDVQGQLVVEGTIQLYGTLTNHGNITNQGRIYAHHNASYEGTQPDVQPVAYQIDWDTNGDGTVDDTTYVAYGETPNHANGSKEPTLDTAYTFTGWDSAVVAVTGTATYTAQFSSSVRTYTVTVPTDPGYTVTYTGDTELEYNSTFTFSLNITQGYYKTSDFAVKANGTALTPDAEGNYTVQVLGDTQITIEGVAQETALAAPTVDTHGYHSEWTANDVTLTPSATANSGIAYYEYSKDEGKTWTKLTGESLTISESFFATDYIFRAVSNAGSVSAASEPVTVKIDKYSVPVTLTGNTQDYLQSDTLEILVNIGLSGYSRLEIKNEDGTWTAIEPSGGFVNPVEYSITENGTYTFRAISGAGVVGAEQSITYTNIDSVKPVVNIDSGDYVSDTWTNQDVTLSVSNTAANLGTTTFQYKVDDGAWQTYTNSITVSEETAGTTYTFKAISASGVESDAVSITVKLDKTAPDGDIKIQENSVKQLLNQITFGLFFNENVDVTISGTDALSGVASIQFYRSQDILTQEEVEAISNWSNYTSITETAVDAEKFIYYARITDQAGNATIVGSDGVVFDLTAPAITGVTNGSTYYTTQSVTVADANLASVTVNGQAVEETLTLAGNVAQTYAIVATDKAGNTTTVTVTMKPIATLADSLEHLTTSNVTSQHQADIQAVQAAVAAVDTQNATAQEQAALQAITDTCTSLLEQIAAVSTEITALTDAVAALPDVNAITSDHKDTVNGLVTRLDALLNSDNLTKTELEDMTTLKDSCGALLDKIAQVTGELEALSQAVATLPDTDFITSAYKDTVNGLVTRLDALLSGDNLTKTELEDMTTLKDSCGALLDKIAQVTGELEALSQAVATLPDTDFTTSAHKDTINGLVTRLDALLNSDNLTEAERDTAIGLRATCQGLLQRIQQAAQAASTEHIQQVADITADRVALEDKDDLTAAKEDLEYALDHFGGNYTQEEKQTLEDLLSRVNQALESLKRVEAVQDGIQALPDTVEPDDTDTEAILDAVKEQYEALSDHEKSLVDETLGEKLESLLAALGDYQMTQGQNAQWTQGTQTGLTFTVNGAFSKFTGIEVDGKAVDRAHYTAISGSTIITLKPEYLNTLSVGKHTLTVIYTDGKVDGQFEVLAKSEPTTPETGDNRHLGLWITLMSVALCSAVGMAATSRRKHNAD